MRFDEGINAAFVNYSYSTDANNGDGGSHQYQYLSLNSGINIASWRLRNNAYWNKFSGQADKWQSIASWAETNIIPWRSRLVVGQTSTDNSVFDSVQFRGVQLGTDAEMRPSSQTGFAPVIRGVANSNARVEVRQNNYLIYSENVPAGPFELNDISAVNRSGDFYVTVIEADGSQTTFTVAYTTLPQLVRAGQWNYQLSAGKYHDGADGYAPALMQSSLSYGLNNTFTLYGGALAAENYRAGAFGVGSNLGEIGALSADYTLAGTTLANGQRKQEGACVFCMLNPFYRARPTFKSRATVTQRQVIIASAMRLTSVDAGTMACTKMITGPLTKTKAGRQALPNTITRPGFIIKSIALIFLPGKLSVRTALSSLTSASKITGIAQEVISLCRRVLTALSIT